MGNTVQKLIVVVSNVSTTEVVERWQFDIECDKSYNENRFVVYEIGPVILCVIV